MRHVGKRQWLYMRQIISNYRAAFGILSERVWPWFLTRDAMLSAVYAVVVCLSVRLSVCMCVCVCVCPSVTLRYCIKTAKRRITQNNATR